MTTTNHNCGLPMCDGIEYEQFNGLTLCKYQEFLEKSFAGYEEKFEVKNEKLETTLREWGRKMKAVLPEGVGYTLFLYDYGAKGNMFYLSTAQREDMLKSLEEFIEKQKIK